MTIDEMINALERVLGALYQLNDPAHYQEVLIAAENITGALRYDFGVTMPDPDPILPGEFEF